MDNLFEQMTYISKATAYDALVPHVAELKQTIRELIALGELEDLVSANEHQTKAFQQLVQKAKLLSI